MKCYFDGSGDGLDKNGDKWITLAGVAGTDAAWAEFGTKWGRMLRERSPVAPYIHMIKLMGHGDPFERINGWDRHKKRKLISDAIVTLSQMDKEEFRWFRCSINESAVGRIAREGEYFPANMYKHLSLVLAEFMVTPYWNNCLIRGRAPEDIFLFYDRSERFMSGIKAEWLKRRSEPNRLVMMRLTSGIASQISLVSIRLLLRLFRWPIWLRGHIHARCQRMRTATSPT